MYTMPSVATVFVPATPFLQQPPSWADVQPIAPQQPQQQVNDIFTGVTYFDVNEKPVQVCQPRNEAQFLMYAQMVQHVPHAGYVRFSAPVAQPSNMEFSQFCAEQVHQVSLGQRSSLAVPVAQRSNVRFDQYIFEKFHRGSLEECSSSSSSSEDLSGSGSPYQHNGTTYFHVPNAFSSGHPSPSELCSTRVSTLNIYVEVLKCKASKEDLEKNGYPMYKNGKTKRVVVPETQFTRGKHLWRSPNDKMRTCNRCHIDFELKNNGKKNQRECVFHTKKTVFDEAQGYVHQCCGEQEGLSEGCEMRRCHVFDQLLVTDLDTFKRTEKAQGIYDERSYNIFAIDCEMVYTVAGPALARLSVVDFEGQLVMDVMVRPPTMVIDPNTEFSGLTIDDIHRAQDTLESCQQKLFSLVNEKTILVGHSLESDLKALRIVHMNVVDTSLLFMSKGYKVGLKKLALDHLGLHIQSNDPTMLGHDAEEDARVSMELLKFWMANNR